MLLLNVAVVSMAIVQVLFAVELFFIVTRLDRLEACLKWILEHLYKYEANSVKWFNALEKATMMPRSRPGSEEQPKQWNGGDTNEHSQ